MKAIQLHTHVTILLFVGSAGLSAMNAQENGAGNKHDVVITFGNTNNPDPNGDRALFVGELVTVGVTDGDLSGNGERGGNGEKQSGSVQMQKKPESVSIAIESAPPSSVSFSCPSRSSCSSSSSCSPTSSPTSLRISVDPVKQGDFSGVSSSPMQSTTVSQPSKWLTLASFFTLVTALFSQQKGVPDGYSPLP